MPSTSPDVLVLWNEAAGSAKSAEDLRDEIRATEGVELVPFEALVEDRRGASLTRVDRVLVAGGDGSVQLAARRLAHRRNPPALGILPLGTGNDLARSLELPLDPREAWLRARGGTPRAIDLMEVEAGGSTRLATNMVSGGNSGHVLEALTPEVKERWGALAYVRGVLDISWTPFRLELEDAGESLCVSPALNFVVANGRTTAGGLPVAPDARLDDGLLDVVVVRDAPLHSLLGAGFKALAVGDLGHEVLLHRRVREVRLRLDPSMPCTADGELLDGPVERVRVLPGRLRVIA